jgi:hypothetical protein
MLPFGSWMRAIASTVSATCSAVMMPGTSGSTTRGTQPTFSV